jgi:hypothetical protein
MHEYWPRIHADKRGSGKTIRTDKVDRRPLDILPTYFSPILIRVDPRKSVAKSTSAIKFDTVQIAL